MIKSGAGTLIWPIAEFPGNWKARWIAPEGFKYRTNACFRARASFHQHGIRDSFPLHISAETTYRLYVNGKLVGRGPVRGTRTLIFFDTFEIAPFLKEGENWIAVDVHCHNLQTFRANPAEPALFVRSHDGTLATDETWQVQPADEWRADALPFTFQIGLMEWRDARGEPEGWQTGRDKSRWQSAVALTTGEIIDNKQFLPRDIPALREEVILPVSVRVLGKTPALESVDEPDVAGRISNEELSATLQPIDCTSLTFEAGLPVVISPQPDHSGVALLADFADEINGGLEIDIEAPAGTILDVGYEEFVINGRLAVIIRGYRFADRYILRAGRQTSGTVFAERGYRYIQLVIRNFSSSVRIHSIRAIQRRYPYVKRGSFVASDALLSHIWTVSANTIAACSTDTIVDCPWRENTLYLNDMLVESITSLQAFGDPRLNARCYRLSASQPRPNGLLPGAVPAGKLPMLDREASADRMVLLASNLFMANMLEEHLYYTGDDKLIGEMLKAQIRILETIETWEEPDGLIQPRPEYWNFIDWSYPDASPNSPDGINYTGALNWFYVSSLAATARILELSGDSRRASLFRKKSERIPQAIDRAFWNDNRGCYIECRGKPEGLSTQLMHAVALLSGQLPDHRVGPSVNALERDDLLSPDLYMHHLVLRAMVKQGRSQQALDRIRKYWGPIVLTGTTTIWECVVDQKGKSAFNGAGSMCHGFSTTPIDFFQSVILGVRAIEPGFRRCLVAPQALDLDQASGTIPTPHGNIDVSWKRDRGQMELVLDVPQGVTAIVNQQPLKSGRHVVRL